MTRTSEDMQRITKDWKILWGQVDKKYAADDDVLEQMNDLLNKSIDSIKPVGQIGLAEDKKLNQKSWEEAIKVISDQYAT